MGFRDVIDEHLQDVKRQQRAVLLQHPSAPVKLDSPGPEFDPLPDPDRLELLDAQEAVNRLGQSLGWRRLATLVRNLASIHGVEVQ